MLPLLVPLRMRSLLRTVNPYRAKSGVINQDVFCEVALV